MLKRLLSLTVLFAVLISCFSVCGFADAAPKVDDGYGIQKQLLKILNVYDGDADLSSSVKRIEFTKLALASLNLTDIASSYEDTYVFTDVSDEDTGFVCFAESLGLISGRGYGLFQPDNPISVDEACKIAVNLLGYEIMAESKGGYPWGYVYIASTLGLLSGVKSDSTELDWGSCINLVYNMLHTEVLETSMWSQYKKKISKIEDNTLLAYAFGILEDEGVLQATPYASLTERESKVGKNRIIIGGNNLEYSDYTIYKYLGYNMKYYFKEEDNDGQVVFLYPYKNTEIVIKSDDIVGYSNGIYTYYNNKSKKQNVHIEHGYDLIYNGRMFEGTPDDNTFNPKSGYALLVDNNYDGLFDVVSVYDFQSRIVNTINSDDYFLSFTYNGKGIKGITLNKDNILIMDFEGNQINFSDIKQGDTVSFALSGKDGETERFCTMFVSSKNRVTGVVKEFNEDKFTILTDDKSTEYKIDGNDENLYGIDEVDVGTSGTFYLDIIGNIFAVQNGAGEGMKTAFLISAGLENKGFEKTLKLKVLSLSDEIDVVECAKKFTLSGPYSSTGEATVRTDLKNVNHERAYNLLTSNGQNNGTVREAVRYSTDAEGKIKVLETAVEHHKDLPNGDVDLTGDGFHYIVKDFTNLTYGAQAGAFMPAKDIKTMNQIILLNSSKTFFTIPKVHGEKPDEKSYFASGSVQNDVTRTVKLYSETGMSKAADIIVISSDSASSIASSTSVVAVEKVVQIYSDDRELWKIQARLSGGPQIYKTDEESIISDIGKGDLIRVTVNSHGMIDKCEKLLDYSELGLKLTAKTAMADGSAFNSSGLPCVTNNGYLGGEYRIMYGAAFENYNNRIILALEDELDKAKTSVDVINLNGFSNIEVFDGKNWRTGTKSDVYSYSDTGKYSIVFARIRYESAMELYLYNIKY